MKPEYTELQKLIKNAEDALHIAKKYADEHGLTFRFSSHYGTGGTYNPDSDMINDPYSDQQYRNEQGGGWYSSSQSC